MNDILQEIPKAVRDAAAAWQVRLTSGTCTDEERRAHAAWLDEAAQHRLAFQEVQRVWQELGAAWARAPRRAATRGGRRGPSGLALLAACAAALAVAAVLPRPEPKVEERSYRTGPGEQLRVDLPGGVRVLLNTGSTLRVRTAGGARECALEGEAFFELGTESHGRFAVVVGRVRIRDIGTRFAVRAAPGRLGVVVVEGEVAVSVAGGDERRAAAGQRILVEGAGQPGEPERVDPEAALAWRTGRLVFRGEPLGEVLREAARYHPVRVSIPEPAVAAIAVTGSFQIADLDGLLAALQVAAPVRVVRPGPDQVRVEARKVRAHAAH